MIKFGGNAVIDWMWEICKIAWKVKKIPVDWELNILTPIHKKGSTTQCKNYRPICLSSVALKVYTRILEIRLRNEVEDKLEEEQCGFRKHRQTQDHIFTVRQVMDKYINRNGTVYLAFLDL